MAEDTRAKKAPEKSTQDEPVPSSEQKTPEPTEEAEVAPKEEEAVAPKEGEEGLELPKGASERTREQFDKLKAQLVEYRKRLFGEKTFETMKPPAPEEEAKPLYDPETGLIDVVELDRLKTRAGKAEQRAARAEQTVQSYIEGQQTREAHGAYPELNPESEGFDENLHVATRRVLMDSMVYPESYGGRQLTYKEAADIARGSTTKAVEEAKEVGAKEAKEALTPKEQASLEATGRSDRRTEVSSSLEDLRVRTRKGDISAVIERLKNIPAVKKE